MLKALIPAATAVGFILFTPAVQAMPIGNVNVTEAPPLTLVYDGCGPYEHRGYYGHCRPGGQLSGRPAVVVGAPLVVAPVVCPPGTHLGRHDRACWPN